MHFIYLFLYFPNTATTVTLYVFVEVTRSFSSCPCGRWIQTSFSNFKRFPFSLTFELITSHETNRCTGKHRSDASATATSDCSVAVFLFTASFSAVSYIAALTHFPVLLQRGAPTQEESTVNDNNTNQSLGVQYVNSNRKAVVRVEKVARIRKNASDECNSTSIIVT